MAITVPPPPPGLVSRNEWRSVTVSRVVWPLPERFATACAYCGSRYDDDRAPYHCTHCGAPVSVGVPVHSKGR